MIISLYAGGMTLRGIQHHLASMIGSEISHETISKIVDQVGEEILIWQQRPLEVLYPVIFFDAIVVKVRDGGHVRNKAAHLANWYRHGQHRTCWASGCRRTSARPGESEVSAPSNAKHPNTSPRARPRRTGNRHCNSSHWSTPTTSTPTSDHHDRESLHKELDRLCVWALRPRRFDEA